MPAPLYSVLRIAHRARRPLFVYILLLLKRDSAGTVLVQYIGSQLLRSSDPVVEPLSDKKKTN